MILLNVVVRLLISRNSLYLDSMPAQSSFFWFVKIAKCISCKMFGDQWVIQRCFVVSQSKHVRMSKLLGMYRSV